MEKIPSFTVNHLVLEPGVYVSRQDRVGGQTVTTFDVRMKAPNREPVVALEAMHTLEHLGATFLRNHAAWRERIIYWGPMGCMTGCYLIVSGDLLPEDVLPLLREAYGFMSSYEGAIPGATPRDCGNYASQDLEGARREASRYLEVLMRIDGQRMRYPQ